MLTEPNLKLQGKISGFVLRNKQTYNQTQIIGFVMLNENLFYDDAEKLVKDAYKLIKSN